MSSKTSSSLLADDGPGLSDYARSTARSIGELVLEPRDRQMTNAMGRASINPVELADLLDSGVKTRVIDVRTGGEFAGGHIPGSINVPLDTFAEHASELANVDHPVVLVCQSGARSERAKKALIDHGKSNMRVLEGGVATWVNAGNQTAGASGKWALDRQVRLVAGSIIVVAMIISIFVPAAKWVAGAVGFGLAFAAATNTCAMGVLLMKLPYNQINTCVIDDVLTELKVV